MGMIFSKSATEAPKEVGAQSQASGSSASPSSSPLRRTSSREDLYPSTMESAAADGEAAPVADGRWASFKANLTDNRVVKLVSTLFGAVKTGFFRVCERTGLSTLCNRIKSLFGFGKTEGTKGKGPAEGERPASSTGQGSEAPGSSKLGPDSDED